MKLLILDLETAPNLAYVWGLFKETINPQQVKETGRVISVAAKWYQDPEIFFWSDFHDGHLQMVTNTHNLITEADAVVTYNGSAFDIPHLNREFLLAKLEPPSPTRDIDLYRVVRERFRFPSNRLDAVCRELGVPGKVKHTGFDLWLRCMADDPKAWALMKRYNTRDILITERLYTRLRPWIKSHPHVGLYNEDPSVNICGRCGSDRLQRRGLVATALGLYQRYQCQKCGGWSRGARSVARVDARPA